VILAALVVFRLAGETVSPAAEAAVPRPVGSLQKPWVVAAWAESHPDAAPPAVDCTRASGCWRVSGHGRVDLPRAFAQSCNAYFLALARATPEESRARALAAAGFEVRRPLSPEASIGLGPLGVLPRIAPAALLRAYRDLLAHPWPSRDDLRLALVDGMRAAALDGTGATLGRRGFLVKTGTVPSLDGRPLATSGWALAAAPGGEGLSLALLEDGTGREAAAALGEALDGPRPARAAAPRESVRIRLLEALPAGAVTATNASGAPVRHRQAGADDAWLGPGASRDLRPGDAVGPGLLRLEVPAFGLVRHVEGTVEARGGPGAVRLVLAAAERAWVDGVLRGELRDGMPELAEELGATALRFLRAGPRHGREDLCDATHCAVFAGRGPLVTWVTPRRAETAGGRGAAPPILDDAAWERVRARAAGPGPAHFTGHCGGAPLSPFAVWGRGPRDAAPCPRHGPGDEAAWERLLPADALARALGGEVASLEAVVVSGVRKTRARTGARTVELLYDDLHRALAPGLGWDALPSPPDSFERAPGGFRARGRGRGHRVGLCLAPPSR
jgi:stage II sporulation protein D